MSGFPSSMRGVAGKSEAGSAVSIIMRTRDRPVLLARALSSVLSQSHSDWRLIVVNDGGDQALLEALLGEYRLAFSGRMTLLHHAVSRGMEAASNTGLAVASGDFVCLHDDDDSWHPDFLAVLTSFLRSPENADFAAVVCHCTVVHERVEQDCIIEETRVHGFHSPDRVDYATMLCGNQFPPISLLVRRRVMGAVGGFNAEMPVLGDWDYNLRIMRVGDIGVVPLRLSAYHHRLADDRTVYGSSVVSQVPRHEAMNALYRNSMTRRLAEQDPASLGLVHILLGEARDNQERLMEAFDRVEATLLQRSWDAETWDGWRHVDLRDRLVRVEGELAALRGDLGLMLRMTGILARVLRPWRRILARVRGRS